MPLPADGKFKYTVPRRGSGQIIVQFADAEVRYNVWPGEPFIIPVQPGTKSILLAGGGGGGGGGGGARTRRRRRRRSGHDRAAAR